MYNLWLFAYFLGGCDWKRIEFSNSQDSRNLEHLLQVSLRITLGSPAPKLERRMELVTGPDGVVGGTMDFHFLMLGQRIW